MEVGIRDLRAHLSQYVGRVQEGHEVVVTDRGLPVARRLPAPGEQALDRLRAPGLVEAAPARGEVDASERVRSSADLVAEQRPDRRSGTPLERLWSALDRIEVSADLARQAGELAEIRAPRGHDAVRLASALALAVDDVVLFSADQALQEAARSEAILLAAL